MILMYQNSTELENVSFFCVNVNLNTSLSISLYYIIFYRNDEVVLLNKYYFEEYKSNNICNILNNNKLITFLTLFKFSTFLIFY